MASVNASLPGNRLGRNELGAIFALNLIQGLPAYFFTVAMPTLLRDRGASLDLVGLTYVVWLPWALKWIWAPVFDARPLLRLSVLRAGPVALALAFLSLLWLHPEHDVAPVLVTAALASTIGATLQIILGAEVIHRTDSAARAIANVLQVAGMTLGGVMGGAVLLGLSEHIGWTSSIAATATMIVLAGLTAFQMRKGSIIPSRRPSIRDVVTNRRILVLPVLVGFGNVADGFLGAWLVDQGHGAVEVGRYLGLFAVLAMIPASAVAGLLLRTMRLGRTLILLFAVKGGLLAAMAFVPMQGILAVAVAVTAFAMSAALMTAVWQSYMASVSESASATGFAFLTSMEALVIMLGGMAAGQAALQWGYSPVFCISVTAVCLAALMTPIFSASRTGAP